MNETISSTVPAPADPHFCFWVTPGLTHTLPPALRGPQGSLGHQRTAPWEALAGEGEGSLGEAGVQTTGFGGGCSVVSALTRVRTH